MEKKRNIESASVFERSGIRAIRARAIEVLLYLKCLFTRLESVPFDDSVTGTAANHFSSLIIINQFVLCVLCL